jgi:hypothetical protein
MAIDRDSAPREDEAGSVVLELDWVGAFAPVGEVIRELHFFRQLLCYVCIAIFPIAPAKKS